MPVYQGFDVLEVEPSRPDEGVNETFTRSLQRLDSLTGKVRAVDRSGVPTVEWQPFQWFMDSRDAIQEFLDWRTARKGMLVPFWVPTWQHDLNLTQVTALGNPNVLVRNFGYTKFMFQHPARRHLAFLLSDGTGTKYYRKVVDSQESGADEQLTLDSALPVVIQPGSLMLSFFTLVRMSADDVPLTWHTKEFAEATLQFIELPKEYPA